MGHFLTWDNEVVDATSAATLNTAVEALTSQEKRCLKICCYLGLSFTYQAAKGLAPASLSRKNKEVPGSLIIDTVLDALVEKGILALEDPGSGAISDVTVTQNATVARNAQEFQFVDPTLAVVVYRETEPSNRAFQHQKVALWIEDTFTDDLRFHFASLTYHFMRAEVWEKASKYMKLTIQTAVLAGAMLEATVVVDHAMMNEALPCSTLESLEAQLCDCREMCERAEAEEALVVVETGEGSAPPTAARNNTAVGGMQQSWFEFTTENKELTLTDIVQNQVKHMDKLMLVNDSGEGYTAVADTTPPSMAVKGLILKAAEHRVKARLQEKRKQEGLATVAEHPPPDDKGPASNGEKKKGGMLGRLFKKRKVAPSS